MIATILVNYRNNADTVECLQSLYLAPGRPPWVIVVDNSEDCELFADLRKQCLAFGDTCMVMEAPSNGGWAAGCNFGVKHAISMGASHVLFLNNDTWVPEHFMEKAEAAAKRFPNQVITGRVRQFDSGANAHAIGSFTHVLKINHWLDDGRLANERQVTFASGCLMLVPVGVLKTIGLLDEKFFMYGEDVEFCLRLNRAKIPIQYLPDLEVRHKEGAACKGANIKASFYDLRNSVWLAWHGGNIVSRICLPFYLLSVYWCHRHDRGKIASITKAVQLGLQGKLGALIKPVSARD